MARKTVSVEWVRMRTNMYLATSDPEWKDQRQGMASLLEAVLFETDNYMGFKYLPSETKEDGTLREDRDDTRREYL